MTKVTLQKRPHIIPCFVATLMFFGSLTCWSYGYYQLLRFVVCGVSVYVAFIAYNWRKLWATSLLFGFIAFLFNPLIPIHLSRKIWQPIDVICAVLFVVVGLVLKKPEGKKQKVV
ncbi:MAG: DUF6804 family protein [Planctomycetota bacterium]|jgi:hypothetical protein